MKYLLTILLSIAILTNLIQCFILPYRWENKHRFFNTERFLDNFPIFVICCTLLYIIWTI